MEIKEFADAVAPHLGFEETYSRDAHIILSDGDIFISIVKIWNDEKRATVCGEYGHLYEHIRSRSSRPSITVSLDRDPQKVAADIQRRLIPKLWEIFSNARLAKEKFDELARQDDEIATRLTSINDGVQPDSRSTGRMRVHTKGGVWGDLYLYEGALRVDLHNVPTAAFERMLEVL